MPSKPPKAIFYLMFLNLSPGRQLFLFFLHLIFKSTLLWKFINTMWDSQRATTQTVPPHSWVCPTGLYIICLEFVTCPRPAPPTESSHSSCPFQTYSELQPGTRVYN